jgi:hypothetical protein
MVLADIGAALVWPPVRNRRQHPSNNCEIAFPRLLRVAREPNDTTHMCAFEISSDFEFGARYTPVCRGFRNMCAFASQRERQRKNTAERKSAATQQATAMA